MFTHDHDDNGRPEGDCVLQSCVTVKTADELLMQAFVALQAS